MLYFIVYKPSPSAQDSNADSAFLLSAPFKWSSEEDWQVGYGERCHKGDLRALTGTKVVLSYQNRENRWIWPGQIMEFSNKHGEI